MLVKKEKSLLVSFDSAAVYSLTANVPQNIGATALLTFNKKMKIKSMVLVANTAADVIVNGFFIDQEQNDIQAINIKGFGAFFPLPPSFVVTNKNQVFFENLEIWGLRFDKIVSSQTQTGRFFYLQLELLEEYLENEF